MKLIEAREVHEGPSRHVRTCDIVGFLGPDGEIAEIVHRAGNGGDGGSDIRDVGAGLCDAGADIGDDFLRQNG